MARRTAFSPAQMAYAQAKALHTVCYQRCRAYDVLIDEEGARLGLGVPYVILPEDHPMMAEAQRLLDAERSANKLLYQAAHNLFDWATEATFVRCGTPEQKASIRTMVATVKEMAYVEGPFEELVDLSMKLKAAA